MAYSHHCIVFYPIIYLPFPLSIGIYGVLNLGIFRVELNEQLVLMFRLTHVCVSAGNVGGSELLHHKVCIGSHSFDLLLQVQP